MDFGFGGENVIKIEIVSGEIEPFPSEDSHRNDGAELVFNGRVRSTENGETILGLFYEYYEGMAEDELHSLALETTERFPISDLCCQHRVGEIPVGETAMHVSIWSEHRAEGLDAMTWFISELKRRIPIWKWAVLPDGSRIPSECRHELPTEK